MSISQEPAGPTDSHITPFRSSYYAGIFLVAASTLLLEITLTKIFSVIHFHYFAFFIVSTALFGYGFSGVLLSVSARLQRAPKERLLYVSSLLFGITTVAAYKLILITPLRISAVLTGGTQLSYLALVYLLLALPFFFSGLAIGLLLTYYTDHINRLYFADLTGAAIGCFAIVFLIPAFGGSGTILAAAILACLAAAVFGGSIVRKLLAVAIGVALALLIPSAERYFPSASKSEKRYFHDSQKRGQLLYTGWSPASRIDVVSIGRERSVIWIDGGTNQSFMAHLNKNEAFGEQPPEFVWKTIEIPYALVRNPKVMIIGPGGGVEVGSALRYHPESITAVELDPLITKIVLGQFSNYIGGIYTRPNVRLINEEGRSFIRRSKDRYDIIQQKNNSHPMAVASGALNLTETYLLTREALQEYLDHLKPGGFLAIERHGGIRLLNLGIEVLKERGIQDYSKRMVLTAEGPFNQVFLLKNGPFSERELDYIDRYLAFKRDKALYTPRMMGLVQNIFTKLMDENARQEILREAPYNLEAPTDDKPFMEHFYKLRSLFSPELRKKATDRFWEQAALGGFITGETTYSDLSLYVILIEALLLSSVFILYPLLKLKRGGVALSGAWHLIVYFFCLGVGFILIEIALIQKYILFIGYPVYSVAVIIFSLLIAAGAGSFLSGRYLHAPFRMLKIVVVAIVAMTAIQVFIVPLLFRHFLSQPFSVRVLLSVLFIIPAGFFMGMPFPIGLSWISKRYTPFVPWAWGINGYATVIGSVVSVILALNFGFRAVFLIAAAIYVLAYFALKSTPAT